ncbi:MAG: hypothetical protein R3F31_16525 [Verrucomicrobiales bacterium]
MDEPTTHLDILSVESLILALEKYEGTLVFISHDVHFIRKLSTKVLHITNGRINSYPGSATIIWKKPADCSTSERPSRRAEVSVRPPSLGFWGHGPR